MSGQGSILYGKFIERPNRFLAKVNINGRTVESFVPNPGRMYEFMIPGKSVFLRKNSASHRKTEYDMIGVLHDGIQVSIDSNLPNRFMRRLLETRSLSYFSNYNKVVPEPRLYNGRVDFRLEGEHDVTLIEVKSCTLVETGHALFPDAPTLRGTRHLKHLVKSLDDGIATKAAVVFVIQRPDARVFSPHDGNDPNFGDALRDAYDAGVDIIPLTTKVVDWDLQLQERIPLIRGPLEF
ncbi:MAG: DNA/RNA nuclease SfsA [Candidatus Thorarchaeota archaeon]